MVDLLGAMQIAQALSLVADEKDRLPGLTNCLDVFRDRISRSDLKSTPFADALIAEAQSNSVTLAVLLGAIHDVAEDLGWAELAVDEEDG